MLIVIRKLKIVFPALLLSLLLMLPAPAQDKPVELQFAPGPAAGTDAARTLQSLVKVRDIGEQYATGGLYLLTHYGDRNELFEKENQKTMDHAWINDTWRFCSAFCAAGGPGAVMGRNWDNQNVGSIILNLTRPTGGYASVSFSRAIDLGFPLNMDLEQIRESPWGERLLLAPFYAMGGINEHGLAVENPGVRQAAVKPMSGREFVFQTYLIRKILDGAKTIEEAVGIAEKHVAFDLDTNSLNAHLFIADASGRSVVLEYEQDQWRKVYREKSWQALSNKPVYNVPDEALRTKCWRYKGMADALEKADGRIDWPAAMQILRNVSQKSTTWSVVYLLPAKELYFSVYQNWASVYHLKPF